MWNQYYKLLFILAIIKIISRSYPNKWYIGHETKSTIKNEPYFILAKQWNSTAEHSKELSICTIKEAVSPIFSVTMNSQKNTFVSIESLKYWLRLVNNNPTSAQKLLLTMFGCGWLG